MLVLTTANTQSVGAAYHRAHNEHYILKHLPLQMVPKLALAARPLLLALGCCLAAPFGAHAMGTFNSVTNLLAMDQLTVTGLGAYKNVSATVHSYSLLGVDNGAPRADAFDPMDWDKQGLPK